MKDGNDDKFCVIGMLIKGFHGNNLKTSIHFLFL